MESILETVGGPFLTKLPDIFKVLSLVYTALTAARAFGGANVFFFLLYFHYNTSLVTFTQQRPVSSKSTKMTGIDS